MVHGRLSSRGTRSATATLGIAALLVFVVAAPAIAAGPTITVTIKASPTVAAAETVVKLSMTATATGATFTEAHIDLGGTGVTPQEWVYMNWSGTKSWSVNRTGLAGKTVHLDITFCNPSCVGNPAQVSIGHATLTTSLAYSPAGAILPGSTLHITVHASTNAGPVTGDLQSKLISGLGDPTVVPSGAVWSPAPYRYIDYNNLKFNLTAGYSFDVPVTGAIGQKVSVAVSIYSSSGDGNATKTFTFTIGAAPPTATPKATPKATRPPSTRAPATATPAPTASPPTPTPLPSSTATLAPATPPQTSAGASGVSSAPPLSPQVPVPTAAPSAASSDAGAPVPVLIALAVVLAVAIGGAAAFARRR